MFVFLRKAGQWVRAQQQCSVAEGVAERPSGVGVDLRDGGAISSRWTQSRQTLTYRSFEQKKKEGVVGYCDGASGERSGVT